jgi:hypothetical protein
MRGSSLSGSRTELGCSGDGKTRPVGLSGADASLVVAVPCVTRLVTGRRVHALGVIGQRACKAAAVWRPADGFIAASTR